MVSRRKRKPRSEEASKSEEKYDFDSCPTRLNHEGPYHRPDVIAAICETLGDFRQIGILLGRRRNAVRDFILANLDVKEVYDEVTEGTLDGIETMTRSMALGGDGPSCRFLLKTLGKDRGYVTRVEQTGRGGEPIETVVTADWSKLTKEQLRAVRSAILDEG